MIPDDGPLRPQFPSATAQVPRIWKLLAIFFGFATVCLAGFVLYFTRVQASPAMQANNEASTPSQAAASAPDGLQAERSAHQRIHSMAEARAVFTGENARDILNTVDWFFGEFSDKKQVSDVFIDRLGLTGGESTAVLSVKVNQGFKAFFDRMQIEVNAGTFPLLQVEVMRTKLENGVSSNDMARLRSETSGKP